ncbi:circadian clock protein KaiC [Pseudomonas lutea]|uniref:non-specific serine/threonine protein kinase n=1 Tax=Pseudomonas lutea TaxID=243924 RepID=A0A9X8M9E9_9PSED|nr:circadian clock protein KaiC [Pseudomonas lutea]
MIFYSLAGPIELKQLTRLESGIEGLDTLLRGGFVAGASYVIQGRPGSGKTILANQIAFNHVRKGERVLFATLLSESHERMFQFLSTLSFFDHSQIGGDIQYLSAFDTMEQEGLEPVVKLLRREISRQKATLLVVDGLLNARSRAETPLDTKRFIAELQAHAAFANCTVLFLTSSRLDDGSPELTMVDGVLDVGEEIRGVRSIRRMSLRKTRGSPAIAGLHEYQITEDGFVVYPRLEAVYNTPYRPEQIDERRVGTGLTSFDQMLAGGLSQSSISLLMGPSGSGKTSMGLSFIAQSSLEEPGLIFGFYETPDRLRIKARSIGLDLGGLIDSGAVHIHWQPTVELQLDKVGHQIIDEVRRLKARRLLIDSLGAIARMASKEDRLMEFFTALTNQLRSMGVTVYGTWEMKDLFGSDIHAPAPELSGITDNLFMMRYAELNAELKRVISILKVRDSHFDPSLREIVISDSGIDLAKAFRNAEMVLSGSATSNSQG